MLIELIQLLTIIELYLFYKLCFNPVKVFVKIYLHYIFYLSEINCMLEIKDIYSPLLVFLIDIVSHL